MAQNSGGRARKTMSRLFRNCLTDKLDQSQECIPALWILEFGAGVFHEFLLTNFVGAATAGHTAGKSFETSQ